ncbi:MAG TPA: response regulator [Thermomicrobiales bacterium]|nr:response regulator [Thermomicrobiales bacterium]
MQFTEVMGGRIDRQAPRILVVDDEPGIVDLLCMLLEEEGFEAAGVTSGYGAAEMIRSERPDLMLTDVMMPGMTGYDLAELAAGVHPQMRVVLMSAAVDPPSKSRFPFVSKPFDLGNVVHVIDETLRAP